MAQDALDLMNHFGWTENVHLVGISMGGMISLELADADPHRFKTLTLTSTTSRRNIPTVQFSFYIIFSLLIIIILVGGDICIIENCICLQGPKGSIKHCY